MKQRRLRNICKDILSFIKQKDHHDQKEEHNQIGEIQILRLAEGMASLMEQKRKCQTQIYCRPLAFTVSFSGMSSQAVCSRGYH